MGASRGLGRAIAAALAREGARVAIASRSRERLEEAAAAIGGGATAFVADASDLERPGRAARARSPRPSARSRSSSPTPAARRSAAPSTHELDDWERGLPLARPRAAGARRRRRARHARARLGADRQRRLQLHPRADPLPQPLQRPPHGRGRLPQDALARGRRRRDHGQHRRHRALRDRAARRQRGGSLEGAEAAARTRSPAAPPRPAPRSTATSSPSSASERAMPRHTHCGHALILRPSSPTDPGHVFDSSR